MHGDDQEDELVEFVNDELFHLEGLAKLGRDDKGRMTLKAKIFFLVIAGIILYVTR